jgi:hypothetical protein
MAKKNPAAVQLGRRGGQATAKKFNARAAQRGGPQGCAGSQSDERQRTGQR